MPQAKVDYTPWVVKVLEKEKGKKFEELESSLSDKINKSLKGSGEKPDNASIDSKAS